MSPAVSPRQAGIPLSAAVEASFMKALQNNNPLSDVDAALFMRSIFSKAADNLSSLDKQISQLHASLNTALEQRARMQKTPDCWRVVVSPMRTLPNEILTEIFKHACRGFEVWSDHDTTPWLLCRVCTRWKDLLLGTPAVWTNFSLDARSFMSLCPLPRLKKAVSLSASLPLTFVFRADQPYEEMSETEVNDTRC